MRKGSKGLNYIFIIITSVLTMIMVNVILFADIYTNSQLSASEEGKAIVYSELKDYEQELKEEINRFKMERAKKVEYLNSLDMELKRLEAQYNELLEKRKRISDKIDSLNFSKAY